METAVGETRVAASPETVKKFITLGCRVVLERGAGQTSGFLDEAYAEAGAQLVTPGDSQAWGEADVLLCVQSPSPVDLGRLRRGALVVGLLAPYANAELDAARQAQAFLEGRIQEIKDIISNYQIIDQNSDEPHDFVRVGDWVTVTEDGYDEEEKYHLVGPTEADPAAGRISNESPLGKALLGTKVNDVVRVNAPNGVIDFKVVKIE